MVRGSMSHYNLLKSFSASLRFLSLCLICGNHDKSIDHILLICPWVESVWFGAPLGIRVDRDSISTFIAWLIWIGSVNFGSKLEISRALSLVALSCWHIWKSRCKAVFYQRSPSPTITIATIRNAFDSFSLATNYTFMPSLPCAPVMNRCPLWSHPPIGGVKVNEDAN